MKILLVNPPNPKDYYNRELYLPSSLLYLSSVLKNGGHETQILDLKCLLHSATPESLDPARILVEKIRGFSPDLLGFGCLFSGNFPQLLQLAERVKKDFPALPIIIGGIHPTLYATEILEKCRCIDFICMGEGESVILPFVNKLAQGADSFEDLDGFAFRKDGSPVVHSRQSYIEDIDTIAFPDYAAIKFEDYYVDTSRWHNPRKLSFKTSVPIISSRSCPMRCRFCSMFHVMGPKWRARTPDNVVNELEYVYKEFGQCHFSFLDDNFSLNKARTLEICRQIITRKLHIEFETPNGLSLTSLDEEVLDALVEAGMVRTYLAIESGSEFIRNVIMKKRLPREKILEVTRLIKKYKDLDVAAFFIMGMPEETWESLMDTYNLIQEINVDRVFLMNIVPFPGTEVFQQAAKDKLLVETDVSTLYLSDDRYLTNYDRFFIKPYNLELDDLRRFRAMCEKLPCVKRPIDRRCGPAVEACSDTRRG